MLRELRETIYQKSERVLVFTQFKEIVGYLDEFLADIFGRKGYVLHGGILRLKIRDRIVHTELDRSSWESLFGLE